MPELTEVSPFHEDVLNDGYRHCDYCYQSAVEDIQEGLPQHEWRKFYLDPEDGLSVCQKCLDRHAEESGSSPA